MDEMDIIQQVDALVAQEHALRSRLQQGEIGTAEEQAQLRALEESLDQCWDLLRQRRARGSAGQDPNAVDVRPATVVGHYLQ